MLAYSRGMPNGNTYIGKDPQEYDRPSIVVTHHAPVAIVFCSTLVMIPDAISC